ncbi:hypothetical protein F2Q68_00013089 [Brassica cretica]|nr:hypothetical protein F2Q68_00013089 [Brassica cretica]
MEDEEESWVSEGSCGFNRSREICLGDLRGCDNLFLELVIFNLRRGEATRDEEDRETFGSRSGFGLMVIIRRGLRFLGWKRRDRGGSGKKGHVLLITYSWMTRALQTFTILFPAQGLLKDTSRREQCSILLGHEIALESDKNMGRSQFGQVTMVTVMGVGSVLNDMRLMRWSQGANEEDFFLYHDWFYLDVLNFMGAKTEKMVSRGILVLGCGSGSSRTFTQQSVNFFYWSL